MKLKLPVCREKVPFGGITDLLGAERNPFDRLAHFSVGFYAYAILEFIESRRFSTRRGFSIVFALAAILAVAALFEIIEWVYAVVADPVAGSPMPVRATRARICD